MPVGVWAALLGFTSSTAALAQSDAPDTAQSLSAHPGWVQAPGMLIRPDCVHEIPKGARVEVKGDTITGDITLGGVLVAHYEPCPEAPVITRPIGGHAPNLAHPPEVGNGWVASVQKAVPLSAGDNIDFIDGTWIVPPNPSATGGLVYLFNGIEPSSGQWILQPVLQWGYDGLFGGNYWVIASWLVNTNGFALYSQPEVVSAGDTIAGQTRITAEGAGVIDWQVWAIDLTNPKVTLLQTATSGLQWSLAFAGVLEVYYITSCSQLPGVLGEFNSAVFQNTFLYHGYPNFLSANANPWFGATWDYGGPSCGFTAFGSGSNPGTAYLGY
jgi:hypothetical protein